MQNKKPATELSVVDLERARVLGKKIGEKVSALLPQILTAELLAYYEENPDDFLRVIKDNIDSGGARRANIVAEAQQFIRQNFTGNVSLDAVADALHLSTFHLSRVFTQVMGNNSASMGKNFTSFVCNVRIEEVKRLLATTDLAMKEIACQVGFGSPTHFNRVFKKATGKSPSMYRMQTDPALAS